MFEAPAPANSVLKFVKAPPADHDEPLYVSVQDVPPAPPKAKADVLVPAPPKKRLGVIKAPPADHEIPSYASVHDTLPGVPPPKAIPAFCVPAHAKP